MPGGEIGSFVLQRQIRVRLRLRADSKDGFVRRVPRLSLADRQERCSQAPVGGIGARSRTVSTCGNAWRVKVGQFLGRYASD